jgi:hypothetical protein
MPTRAPGPTALMGWALVKISASGPMPTSRYWDHMPWASKTSLSWADSGEPGFTLRRLSPMTATTACRTASARLASPRACSSITRSSMLATKVTPAAFTACKSHGAMNHAWVGSRAVSSLLAKMAGVLPKALACPEANPCRTFLAAWSCSSKSLHVKARPERS